MSLSLSFSNGENKNAEIKSGYGTDRKSRYDRAINPTK